MKRLINISLCFLILLSCSDNNNLLEDIAVRGGYVQFKSKPTLEFNILKLDTEKVSEEIVDPNNNIQSYSLALYHNSTVVENFKTINSFPSNLDITIAEIINALGITEDDVKLNTKFTLVATIVTPTGTYSGFSPNYDSNNVNQGGNTTTRLKSTGLLDAIEFDVTFFLPPPKKVRGTSFEEVAIGAATDTYERNGGLDETGDLTNRDNPPYVDFTATGTGTNDEIGFNTEYYAVSGISSSGLGFSRERIGVYSLFEDYEAYPDGEQGYHIEDADGGIRITFDTVEIPADEVQSGVSFDVYFNDTSWESKDGLYAYANIVYRDNTTAKRDIVELYDNDVEAVAGSWKTFVINSSGTGFLKNVKSYELVIEAQSGATTESFDIDNIVIYVPNNE